MDITDEDGLWRLTHHSIENRKTGEVRMVTNMPPACHIAYMPYDTFMRKCQEAFATGNWPMTHWKSGKVSY